MLQLIDKDRVRFVSRVLSQHRPRVADFAYGLDAIMQGLSSATTSSGAADLTRRLDELSGPIRRLSSQNHDGGWSTTLLADGIMPYFEIVPPPDSPWLIAGLREFITHQVANPRQVISSRPKQPSGVIWIELFF